MELIYASTDSSSFSTDVVLESILVSWLFIMSSLHFISVINCIKCSVMYLHDEK